MINFLIINPKQFKELFERNDLEIVKQELKKDIKGYFNHYPKRILKNLKKVEDLKLGKN